MQIIFRCPKTGTQLAMPVTPPGFDVAAGREVEPIDMAQTGQLALPGLQTLMNEEHEYLLPAERRNYTDPTYTGNPYDIVNQLIRWSDAGEVLRYIVTDTPINLPVLLGPITYGQHDGTGDVTVRFQLHGYREPVLPAVSNSDTKNSSRPSGGSNQPAASKYVVKKGDSLWAICRKFYGKGQLAYKLAAVNGIKNANLIFPGQELRLPPKSQL